MRNTVIAPVLLWLTLFGLAQVGLAQNGDLVTPETVGIIVKGVLTGRRVAVVDTVASVASVPPKRAQSPGLDDSNWFQTADTGTHVAQIEDTRARARARNSLRGKIIDIGKDFNAAGENGTYSSYAALIWNGKVVNFGGNAAGDPDAIDRIRLTIGDRLELQAQSFAEVRASLAYRIVDLAEDFFDGSEFVFHDDLVNNYGFTSLFHGAITLGNPEKDVFSGDFQPLTSLFDIDVDPITHHGTVSFRDIGVNAVSFFVDMPEFSETQAMLLAGDVQASVSAAHGGAAEIDVSPIPEPGSLIVWSLLGLTFTGACWWRRRRR